MTALSASQKWLLHRIPAGMQLLVVGLDWPDVYIVEPCADENGLKGRVLQRGLTNTIKALVRMNVLVSVRVEPNGRGYNRREWFRVERPAK